MTLVESIHDYTSNLVAGMRKPSRERLLFKFKITIQLEMPARIDDAAGNHKNSGKIQRILPP